MAALPGIGACIQTRELFGTAADAGVVTDAGTVDAAPVSEMDAAAAPVSEMDDAAPVTEMDAARDAGSCPGRIEMDPPFLSPDGSLDGCAPAPFPSDDAAL